MRIVLQLACGLLMYGAPLSARGARIRPIATPAPASLVELLQPVHELGVRLAPHGLGALSNHGGDLGRRLPDASLHERIFDAVFFWSAHWRA